MSTNLKRRSTVTKSRGLTLVELMVTVTIFLALAAAMGAMLFQSQRASEKAVSTNDANSQALILFEKLRREIRKGRVIGNPVPEELHYWIYETENGLPKFGSDGALEFISESGPDPDTAVMKVEDGNLVRSFQNDPAILSSVGRDGEVNFEWLVGIQAIRVRGQVGELNPSRASLSSVKEFHFMVALSNVE